MISCIVAITTDNAIGKGDDQLYYIKDDLKRFRRLTVGKTVIMGSNTFRALPKGALPERKNVVLTRNISAHFAGAEVAHSVTEAIKAIENEGVVIGGEQIYRLFMPLVERIYITEIDVNRPDATHSFPELNPAEWNETERGEWQHDNKNDLRYRYITLERKH